MLGDQLAQPGQVFVGGDLFQLDHAEVAVGEEAVVRVPDVGDAARHAGREVAARWPEDHDAAACHVFAAVVADAFDDRAGAAVADAEPLGRPAAEKRFAARRAIQRHIADEDVVFGHEA